MKTKTSIYEQNYLIVAHAPTAYQYGSLRAFRMQIKPVFGGSFSAEESFFTKDDAKNYLIELARDYYEDELEYERALEIIENHNQLKLDAVTGYIVEKT